MWALAVAVGYGRKPGICRNSVASGTSGLLNEALGRQQNSTNLLTSVKELHSNAVIITFNEKITPESFSIFVLSSHKPTIQ